MLGVFDHFSTVRVLDIGIEKLFELLKAVHRVAAVGKDGRGGVGMLGCFVFAHTKYYRLAREEIATLKGLFLEGFGEKVQGHSSPIDILLEADLERNFALRFKRRGTEGEGEKPSLFPERGREVFAARGVSEA